jgi:ubiquinone/menaquinone biosynthesis C-methylase UbiE
VVQKRLTSGKAVAGYARPMTSSFAHDSRQLAESYDRLSDLQFEGGKRLFDRLGLKEGGCVLDVGCGTGRLARWMAERVGPNGRVAGVDPLEERIAIARSGASAGPTEGRVRTQTPASPSHVRFEVGQAEDLGAFQDASFDAACMSSVLHWVWDKSKALAEVRRVLRPGGRVGVTTLPHELRRAGTIARVLEPLLVRAPYSDKVDLSALTFAKHGVSTSDLMSLLLETRLELVELHITERTRRHASGEDLALFLEASSFGNFFRIVPEELRARLRADLVSAFEGLRGPEGVVVRDWGLLFVATRAG